MRGSIPWESRKTRRTSLSSGRRRYVCITIIDTIIHHILTNYTNDAYIRYIQVKHARIAMLAAVGWPTSELYHYQLSNSMGFEDILADGGRAPSVLNGGLDNVYVLFALGEIVCVLGCVCVCVCM
jgi:hypothetical protein